MIKFATNIEILADTGKNMCLGARKIGTGRVFVIGYVENILRNHLELSKEEINRLHKEQNSRDLL